MVARLRLPLFLSVVFVIALALRIGATVALRDLNAGPSPAFGADPVEFDSLARHVSRGEGYVNEAGRPTAFRAPGFPLFLSGLYRLVGPNYPIVYLVLGGVGAASCVLTYFIARQLVSESSARVAALLACLYFPHIYFSTLLLSENLFVFTLCILMLVSLKLLRDSSVSIALLVGLSLGACILVRPFAQLLVPLLVGLIVWRTTHTLGQRFVAVGTMAMSAAFVVAPWTIRNSVGLGHPVLVSTNGGSTFYGGNNDLVSSAGKSIGTWVSTRKLPGRDAIDRAPDEVAHDRLEWQLGRDWLRGHPQRIPMLMAAKAARLILPDVDSSNRKYVALNLACYTPFLALMMVGLFRSVRRGNRRDPQWLLIHGIALATLLTALIFWGSPRFRDANLPVLMIYAAVGLSRKSIVRASENATDFNATPLAFSRAA